MNAENQLMQHYTVNLMVLSQQGDKSVRRIAQSLIKLLKLQETLEIKCEKCNGKRDQEARLCSKCSPNYLFENPEKTIERIKNDWDSRYDNE